jgi:CPA1 family monovalent cation:H+ antiporter
LQQLIFYGFCFSGLVIALRMVWIFPGVYLAYVVRRRLLHQDEPWPGAGRAFVVGWTGMRGVLALAAAISLPELLEDGTAFPQRNLIIFMTFCVILVTLVLQGLTLAPLIRTLGLGGAGGRGEEEEVARREILQAALAWLEASQRREQKLDLAIYKELTGNYQKRLDSLHIRGEEESEEDHREHLALREHRIDAMRDVLKVERDTALHLRNEGRINDEVLRRIQYELDLTETKLVAVQ